MKQQLNSNKCGNSLGHHWISTATLKESMPRLNNQQLFDSGLITLDELNNIFGYTIKQIFDMQKRSRS